MKGINDTEGDGFVGFVHQVVIEQYLSKHEAPEDIELYVCGPPMMNQAVLKMADDWGIPDENVRFDDFGGQKIGTRFQNRDTRGEIKPSITRFFYSEEK